MQLFSMGVNQLNADGTIKNDATGAPLPNYTAADVHDVARALTGWTYARLAGAAANDGNALDYSQPMVTVAANYDTAAKTFLGTTVAGEREPDRQPRRGGRRGVQQRLDPALRRQIPHRAAGHVEPVAGVCRRGSRRCSPTTAPACAAI